MKARITNADRERAVVAMQVASTQETVWNAGRIVDLVAQAYADERARCNARLAAGRKLGQDMAAATRLNADLFEDMEKRVAAQKPVVSAAVALLRETDVFDLDTLDPGRLTAVEVVKLVHLLKATRTAIESGDL